MIHPLRAGILLIAVSFILCTSSCVTMIAGKHTSTVEIKTSPSGADVYDKNKVKLGTTPYTVSEMKEKQMVLTIQKDGYEDSQVELQRHSEPALLFMDAMLFCIPCIVDLANPANLYSIEAPEGTLKLRKKLKEYDKSIIAELGKVDITFDKMKEIGKVNGQKKTMSTPNVERITGYPDYYNGSVYEALKKGYFDLYYSESAKRADGLNRPKVSISVTIKDLNFDLRGDGLRTYTGNCSIQTEWKIFRYKENKDETKDAPIATFALETSGFRSKDNEEYIIPSLLGEASKDFMEIDTLYDFLNKLTAEAVVAQKGEVIKIKSGLVKQGTPASKDRFKNAIQSVVTVTGTKGFGSGVVISPDGYIVTNYHVVQGEKNISVKLSQNIKLSADVVKTNPEYDLALLKLTASELKSLPFANSDEAEIGDEVYAVGTPSDLELGQTITKGIISGKRTLENINYIQSDVSISPGNSGGPLLNDKGQVIGITTMKIIGKGIEGIGFSIPSNIVLEMLNITIE
jgi:serine protease Do